ncbi:uncharacterized protein LOC125812771 [Solanum verrucosum]|uniref:uncharacterized protein LOC125812771 n=1 Tax=Solanum verrucosum TaxID=315347 RepID=UPI0020D1E46B|nr:uncharacterized protein LOC125812771 [Solanum verrucosum]
MAPRGGGRCRYSGKRTADPVATPLMSSFARDQAPSLPELPTPVTPDSVAVNISGPSPSVGIEIPRNDIVSTTSSNTTDGTRIPIEIVMGRLELSNNVSRAIAKIFKENWILKDMIGSQLHQRLRTSTGRSLTSDSIGILQLKVP